MNVNLTSHHLLRCYLFQLQHHKVCVQLPLIVDKKENRWLARVIRGKLFHSIIIDNYSVKLQKAVGHNSPFYSCMLSCQAFGQE